MSAEGRSPAQMLCTSSGTPHAIALPVGLAKLRGGGNPILPATAVTEVLSSLGRRAHRRRLRPRPGRRRGAAARRDRGHRRDRAAVPARDHGPARRRRRLGAADHPGRRHRRRAEHPGVSAGHRCRVQRPLPMLSRSVKPAGDAHSRGAAPRGPVTAGRGARAWAHDGGRVFSGGGAGGQLRSNRRVRWVPRRPQGESGGADPAAIAIRDVRQVYDRYMEGRPEVHERRPHAGRPPGTAGLPDPAVSPATRRRGALDGHPCLPCPPGVASPCGRTTPSWLDFIAASPLADDPAPVPEAVPQAENQTPVRRVRN